ncbi:MAG: META domain-containing protein [Chryseolinea sp.]
MNKIPLLFVILTLFQCKSTQNDVSTATLENTYWKLSEMNGKPLVTPADAKEVHMILTSIDNEKRVKGFSGCNNIGGNFTLEANKIHFTIISTKMFCSDRMDVEDFFTKALSKAETYIIKGEELSLYQGEAKLITFQSVYFK